MICEFDQQRRCVRCGWQIPDRIEGPVFRNCRPRGLGDLIADGLAKLGIKKCGGCQKRQEKLNRFGEWVRRRPFL